MPETNYDLRKMIQELAEQNRKQHEENLRAQAAEREAFVKTINDQRQTFQEAINEQRDVFQEALNKQFVAHIELSKQVTVMDTTLKLCIGSGQPGEGRLGSIEMALEKLKQFRWQTLAILATILLLTEHVERIFGLHH